MFYMWFILVWCHFAFILKICTQKWIFICFSHILKFSITTDGIVLPSRVMSTSDVILFLEHTCIYFLYVWSIFLYVCEWFLFYIYFIFYIWHHYWFHPISYGICDVIFYFHQKYINMIDYIYFVVYMIYYSLYILFIYILLFYFMRAQYTNYNISTHHILYMFAYSIVYIFILIIFYIIFFNSLHLWCYILIYQFKSGEDDYSNIIFFMYMNY